MYTKQDIEDFSQIRQYSFFHVVNTTGVLLVWGYFVILLLKVTNYSIPALLTAFACTYIGIFLGVLLGNNLIAKIGYTHLYRFGMLLTGLSCLLVLALYDFLHIYYPLFTLIAAIGRGMFWAANNVFNLREVHGQVRAKLLSTILAIALLLEVLVPFAAGAIIDTSGYRVLMVLGAALYLLAALFPWSFNKVPRQTLNFGELRRVARNKQFRYWSLITIGNEMLNSQRLIILAILPFILLQSELSVGALGSLLGLVSAVLAFTQRGPMKQDGLHVAYLGGGIAGLSTAVFTFIWTVPALAIRGVLAKVGIALFNSHYESLVYRNRELLLGDFLQESAVEMETYAELLLLLARIINILLIALLAYALAVDLQQLLKILLLITVPYELVAMLAHHRLNLHLRK